MPMELWNMNILSYPLDETFLVSVLLSLWNNDVYRLILQFTILTAVFYRFKTSLKVNITKKSNKWGGSRNLVSFWVSPLIFVRMDDFQLTLTVTVFINCFFQPHLLTISKLHQLQFVRRKLSYKLSGNQRACLGAFCGWIPNPTTLSCYKVWAAWWW